MNIISVSVRNQAMPRVEFQGGLSGREPLFHHRKDKVVVIMGATGSGKSKLAIDLATSFRPAEVVNSDKMQVYTGLDITTNKITKEECRGVPHHLLGIVDPNTNFTANEFCQHASMAVNSIVERDCLPLIAGGSNSYLDALVNDFPEFRLNYECCFLWVDVELPVLYSFLQHRVDRMIEAGQVDEVRKIFDHSAEYTRGIRRAIGVPELDQFLRTEDIVDDSTKKRLLKAAIAKIKLNNCKLAHRQLQKIHRLHNMWKRNMHRLDATEAFKRSGEGAEEAWENHVLAKSRIIVHKFLCEEKHVPAAAIVSPKTVISPAPPPPQQVAMAAVAAATH